MSPPKTKTAKKSSRGKGAGRSAAAKTVRKPALKAFPENESPTAWLNQNIASLADEITRAQFKARPELDQLYGSAGRQKCSEDAAYHLHYLAAAIDANAPDMFSRYIGWAKVMLSSRGVDPKDITQNLLQMKDVLLRQTCGEIADLIREYIHHALEQFPRQPITLSSYIDPKQPHGELANRYLQHLLLLERNRAIDIVLNAVEKGNVTIREVFQHVITPAQQEIGRLWQLNQITIVQEHYCTISSDLLLMRLARRYTGITRDVSALTLCAANEEHCLGIKLLSEVLESDGWRVECVASKSPTADVVRFLESHPTDLVAVSVGTPMSISKTKELIHALKKLPAEARPRVLVGGAALNAQPDAVATLGADGYASTVLDGLQEANRIVRKAS